MLLQWIAYYLNHYDNYNNNMCGYHYPQTHGNGASQAGSKNKKRSKNKGQQALEAANMKKGLEKKIEEGNIGYEMLVKMGYQAGQGLGKAGNGILQPLPLEKKIDRKGLGAEKPQNGTTADGTKADGPPNGTNADKPQSGISADKPQSGTSTGKHRNGISADKPQNGASTAKPPNETTAVKPQNGASTGKPLNGPSLGLTTNAEVKPASNLSRNQRKRLRRKEKASSEAKRQAQMAQDQANVAQKAATKAKKLAAKAQQAANLLKVQKATKPVVEPKTKPQRKHSPIRAPTPTVTVKQQALLPYSHQNAADGNYLRLILERFYSDIELMQLRLEATASLDPDNQEGYLVLAKVRVGNNEIIADHAFEFIRTELVGWIGVYQEQDMETPIFHAMINNHCHITVVCDNAYAYQCLEHCIQDIAQIKTMNNLHLLRLPPITPLIYCFDVIYEGLARDPDLFLHQVHLHKPKLRTDCWIVVSHEVCSYNRKTLMTLLIDERSALALNFQYSSNFCVCLQTVLFRNRGIVTETFLN